MSIPRVKDFIRLRKHVRKEVSKRKPNLQLLLAKVQEQVSILQSIIEVPLVTRKKRMVAKSVQVKRKAKPSISVHKIAFITVYLVACALLDWFVFSIVGLLVIGLIGAEATILFSAPKLLEWLRQ